MTILIILLFTLLPQKAAPASAQVSAQDKQEVALSSSDLIKTLELEVDTLSREEARLESRVAHATGNLKAAQRRLRSVRKRLRHRTISSLTIEESERFQNALDAVGRARSELNRAQIDLMEIQVRIATVGLQIKLFREMSK